jgi:hypothetical protein
MILQLLAADKGETYIHLPLVRGWPSACQQAQALVTRKTPGICMIHVTAMSVSNARGKQLVRQTFALCTVSGGDIPRSTQHGSSR